MADFLFCRTRQPEGRLTGLLTIRYPEGDAPRFSEFHGDWGSLAVTNNPYRGFLPYETPAIITAVAGGPVLRFADNEFLTREDSSYATRLIAERSSEGKTPNWQDDLDGPFALFEVHKPSGTVTVTTDLLSFIPIFRSGRASSLVIGTHVDAVADASGANKFTDTTSVADYVFHGAVTYPHTLYAPVLQLAPATRHTFTDKDLPETVPYWVPVEGLHSYGSIEEAADALRRAMQDYISSVTAGMSEVGCFLSGGEDSRFVLGLLPKYLDITAITFHHHRTREVDIAEACAHGYGVRFLPVKRPRAYHAQNFQLIARLIGAGSEPKHAPAIGRRLLEESVGRFTAVFGGFLSDTLMKGNNIKTLRMLPFMPALQRPLVSVNRLVTSGKFKESICLAVRDRRNTHLAAVEAIRPNSAMEWSLLWPISMLPIMGGYQANRRLFRTYEPFMSSGVVKVSARTPQRWKYNRDVFHRAAQPYYEPVKWLPHEDGRVPYFGPRNILVHAASWLATGAERRKGKSLARSTGSKPSSDMPEWTPLLETFNTRIPQLWQEYGLASADGPQHWNGKYQLRLLQSLALNHKS